jgi:hypothetical protein
LYRSWNCDIINMSTLPEAKLAREAELAYQAVCMATDYDCWRPHTQNVTVGGVLENLRKNADNAERVLLRILPALETLEMPCGAVLKHVGKVNNSFLVSEIVGNLQFMDFDFC